MRLPTFERTANGLLAEADIFELELVLSERPEAGDLIPGGRACVSFVGRQKGAANVAVPESFITT